MILKNTSLFETLVADKTIYEQLKDILGMKPSGELYPIEVDVNSDRNDPNLSLTIINAANKLQKIATLLNCSIEDLKSQYDTEESDHELACHKFDFNNNVLEGACVTFKKRMHILKSYDRESDTWTLQLRGTDEEVVTSRHAFDITRNWCDLLDYVVR